MNKKLEKFVIDEVKSRLVDIDIDSILDSKRLKQIISDKVDAHVMNRVLDEVNLRIYKNIKQRMPLIDASINEIVRETMVRVENLLKGDKYV